MNKNKKKNKEILVEITGEQAKALYESNAEVFVMNDDNSESLIDEITPSNYCFNNQFWENNRFAIEAKTIVRRKS